ncbi:MAG: bifunctional UDP-3-O-[3-hydroxymyristoyl] N-acetylglucosamine deacetylase/3-hydroxyacyl-ACP dehydratase [Elusimicrobiota bacterium]
MDKQRTIEKEISYSGIGLHTGNTTTVSFKPAPANSGIKFVRSDLTGRPEIAANFSNVLGVVRGTSIGVGEVQIHTVEHLMAAVCGLGIDNLAIEVNANEPPVADGSSRPFIDILEKAGIIEQDAPRNYFAIESPLKYSVDNVEIIALPDDKFRISYIIEYNHPLVSVEFASFEITPEIFKKEISSARTYCFDYEIEMLKKKGLGKGGSLDNAIVIGEKNIHNKEALRYPNEFVRHKILDLIGDLYLLGCPLKGHIIAVRSGHGHNINFAKQLSRQINKKPELAAKKDIAPAPVGRMLDIIEIKKVIPHRYPFLLIDKVIVTEEQKKAVGYKCVTANEEFFQGHFPERPIMPGVLIVEAMAQTACVLFLSRPDLKNKLAYFMGLNEVKFRRPVVPGDVLRLEVEVLRARERGGKVQGKAYVDEHLAAESEFMFTLVDK